MRKMLMTFVPGLVGAAVGGYLGSLIVHWTQRQGFYTVVLPGALAGLLCGFCSVDHSKVRGALCALIALGSCLLAEWTYFWPAESGGFGDFLTRFPRQPPVTLIMVGLGTFLGFWWGRESTSPWRHRFAMSEVQARPKSGPPITDD